MYDPVISQLTRAVLVSWGLIVGWNIAPPPPGPITLKSPGRGSLAPSRNANRATTRKKANAYFPLLSLTMFRFLFVRYSLLCHSFYRLTSARRRYARVDVTLLGQMQQPRSILEVNLFQYPVRQAEPINPPPPLRRCWRWSVIEVFVLGFQKAVINIVQLVIEHLLWR